MGGQVPSLEIALFTRFSFPWTLVEQVLGKSVVCSFGCFGCLGGYASTCINMLHNIIRGLNYCFYFAGGLFAR